MLLDRLVIGSSVESAVHSVLTDSYFLPTLKFGPMFYQDLDFNVLGHSRSDLTWSRMLMMKSLLGKLLGYEELESISISENTLKISSNAGVFKYDFNLCEVFDTTDVDLENEIVEYHPSLYTVYDDFELSNLGGRHRYLEPKSSGENLASIIHYYISRRVDGANYVTDCVSESVLTKEQLNDFEYSDSMVRFAVIHHLESIGVRGNYMNLYKNGKPKYRKPKVVHSKRIVVEREMNLYKDSKRVKFINPKLKGLFG